MTEPVTPANSADVYETANERNQAAETWSVDARDALNMPRERPTRQQLADELGTCLLEGDDEFKDALLDMADLALYLLPQLPTIDVEQVRKEAYLRGHEDGFWNGKTTDMSPSEAAHFMEPYRSNPDRVLPPKVEITTLIHPEYVHPNHDRGNCDQCVDAKAVTDKIFTLFARTKSGE